VVAIPGIAKPVPHFPEGIIDAMIDNDFEWAATNRERILAEWEKRYGAKTEAEG
jgi:iron(III) transport system substrate-binding protein